MDAQTKDFVRGIWMEAWEMGSHGSTISFDEWFADRFAKQILKAERKKARKSDAEAPQ